MADYPPQFLWLPPTNAIVSQGSIQSEHARMTSFHGNNNSSAVWPAANRAIYCPFQVGVTCTAYQMVVIVAIQSGNIDVGIYDELGNRLVSMGSQTVGAAGAQVFNIADTVLTPGTYFTGVCVDNTTASFARSSEEINILRVCGIQQQAVGAVTLPNPATFANPASAYMPAISVALTSTAL